MNQSHTPGPWRQDTMSGTTVWGGDKTHGNAVAVCQGFEREENRANAALIAAAPELLEALREALGHIEDSAEVAGQSEPFSVKDYYALIAKATGG